jgi:ankyrin repeat protein
VASELTVKTAIETGDAAALHRLLAEDASRANALICWGKNDSNLTHPLHYVCDMLFVGTLERGRELPLLEALIGAGADLDFQRASKTDTPLIGAASLASEDAGLAMLRAGARPDVTGIFGETALHWAALLGEDRLAAGLIEGSDLDLKDEEYSSPPLGWAIHGRQNPPKGNQGGQCEVAALLVAAGARVEPAWLESEQIRADPPLLAALTKG